MSNPAKELYEQFAAWRRDGSHPAKARGMGHPEESAAAHRRAMRQLTEIERRVDELDRLGRDVSVYRRYLTNWTKALVCYPNGWAQNADSTSYPDQVSMDMLHSLAERLDGRFNQIRTDSPKLRALIEAVDRALREDDSISDEMRWYVANLLAEIRHTIDDHEYIDGFDLNDALQRLWVSLKAARIESEKPERWERASRFWRDVAVGVIVSLPQLSLAAYQTTFALGQ